MTQTANLQSFQNGETVYNTEFENFQRLGIIVERNGTLKVETVLPENGKTYTVKISDKWQTLPNDAPKDVLAKVLEFPASKGTAPETSGEAKADNPAPAAKDEKEAGETFEPLTEIELETRKKLVAEYKRADQNEQNAYLRKCEIINQIRTEKLFRDEFRTFAEFAAANFAVTREYAQNLAQIGAFYTVSKDFIKDNKLSVNSINQLVRNQNKLAESLGMEKADLSEFSPIIEKVLSATIEASKNEKGKVSITPRIVDTVAEQIKTELAEMKTEKTGSELIALAASKLGEKRADILTKTREALSNDAKGTKNPPNGSNSPGNGNSPGTYAGILSNLEIKCTLHTEFVGNKILNIGNGTIQTKCLCKFKQIGFDLVPFEIEGKRVKSSS